MGTGIGDDERASERAPTHRSCATCGDTKPLHEFAIQSGGRWGRHTTCKACRASRERDRYRRRRAEILEAARTDERRARRIRWRALERKYGLSEAEWMAIYSSQSGTCAICGLRADLVVDHDHTSGLVRGLLCRSCNFGIGELEDNPGRCRVAAQYLRDAHE